MLRVDPCVEVCVVMRVQRRLIMIVRSKGRYHPSVEIENEMNVSLEPEEMAEEENFIVRFVRELNTNTILPFFSNYGQFRSINIRYRENPQG